MSESKFSRLFKYMRQEFKDIHDQLEQIATKLELNTLTNAVDTYAKQTETYMKELLALAHKVNRLEQWIHQIAAATGAKLTA